MILLKGGSNISCAHLNYLHFGFLLFIYWFFSVVPEKTGPASWAWRQDQLGEDSPWKTGEVNCNNDLILFYC